MYPHRMKAYMYPWSQYNRQLFEDRGEGGRRLARRLVDYANEDAAVISLPRGGVVTGYEVARALHLPLNVVVSRKVGLPGNREFGIGAVSELGVQIVDDAIIELFHPPEEELAEVISEEREELVRRVGAYRGGEMLPELTGKTVILVDDGLATGVTAKAAIETLRKLSPEKIILAAPICAHPTARELRLLVDDVVCIREPSELRAIGHWYRKFDEVSDEKVQKILESFEESEEGNERRIY